MAWVLQFDGVNDSAVHSGFTIASGDDFSLRIKASSASNASHTRWLGGATVGASNPRVIYLSGSGTVRMEFDGSVARNWAIGLDVTLLQVVEFRRTSGQLDLYIAGVLQSGGFSSNTDTFTDSSVFGINFNTVTQQGKLEYIELDINGTPIHAWDATASSHTSGTPILTDTIGGNNATGVNMPTDGSAWIDLGGGGISVTGQTANYNVTFYDAVIDLAGEIVVSGESQSHSVTFYDATVDLTGEVLVNAETQSYQVQFFDGQVSLISGIEVQAQSQSYDVTFYDAVVQLSGVINISAENQDYSVTFYDATVSITELWTNKPKVVTNWSNQAKTVTIWTDK